MEWISILGIIGYGLYKSNDKTGKFVMESNSYISRGKKGSKFRDTVLSSGNRINETYDTQPTNMIKKYSNDAEKRWVAAQAPKQSGIILPNKRPAQVMPFYTSGKSMNTNGDYKQRKMELFSGNMLEGHSEFGAYKHKQEANSMFGMAPQGFVTSGGTVGNPPGDAELQKTRSVDNRTHNNVLPTEQVMVGPGLGVGPEVAATGGFHQFYRQLPLNVNEYKLTQLPGVLNHGASTVQKPEINQISQINKNPGALVMDYDDRPPLATTGAYLGLKQHGLEPRECAGLRPADSYSGIAAHTVDAHQSRYVDDTRGRQRIGDGQSVPPINKGTTMPSVGAYSNDSMKSETLASQREIANKFFGTAGPGAVQPNGSARPMYAPGATLREQYEGTYHTGPAKTVGPNAERMDILEIQPESRNAKRANQNRGHTPGKGRGNTFLPEGLGDVYIKGCETYSSNERSSRAVTTPTFIPYQGKNERSKKSQAENPWGDVGTLNIAKKQLAGNKLNVPLYKA